MASWGEKERRKSTRVVLPCMIGVTPTSGDEYVVLAQSENISIHGAFLILRRDIKAGTEVNIEINLLNSQDHIRCKGRIVRCTKRTPVQGSKLVFYDIGVEFTDMSAQDTDKIKLVVEAIEGGTLELPEVKMW